MMKKSLQPILMSILLMTFSLPAMAVNCHLLLDEARPNGVQRYLTETQSDVDAVAFLATYYPELTYYTGYLTRRILSTHSDASIQSHSERLYGEINLTYDKRINQLLLLRWIQANRLDEINAMKIGISQPELDAIRSLFNYTVESLEDWDALITYLAIRGPFDMNLTGANPSLARLSEDQKRKVLSAMEGTHSFRTIADQLDALIR